MKTNLIHQASPYSLPLLALFLLTFATLNVQADVRFNSDKAIKLSKTTHNRDRQRSEHRVVNNRRDAAVNDRGGWKSKAKQQQRNEHRVVDNRRNAAVNDRHGWQKQVNRQQHNQSRRNTYQGHTNYRRDRSIRTTFRYQPLTVRRYVNHYIPLSFAGLNYYFNDGRYYRRHGTGFSLVFSNVGTYINRLPYGYRKVMVHNYPYYYVNRRYYIHDHNRDVYVYVNNPYQHAAVEQAVAENSYQELYIYPQQGQTTEQMEQDRYECHAWAVAQTGFDPSLGQPGDTDDYRRAQSACLEGRGYVVN